MADTCNMIATAVQSSVRRKYERIRLELDERARRLWAAIEAKALGHGGVAALARATGLSESTVWRGLQELKRPGRRPTARGVRRPGGGRKRCTEEDPELLTALESLVDPSTRGDPMSPLRWTCKSTYQLAEVLTAGGHPLSPRTVSGLLRELGYSLQAPSKSREGADHPDRDAQFAYINNRVKSFQRRGQPVVSVDCKKKELVGDFAQKGQEYQPKGEPQEVRVHDFVDKKLGKAIPYGVYDQVENCGWVSVGSDHDTAQFAVEALRRWWRHMGRSMYPKAKGLLVTADGGGSNGNRNRLWKVELQKFADEAELDLTVCHFPPGASKWNMIEHRMFSHMTMNWRGRPLVSHEAIIQLIANTTTKTGLLIRAKQDRRRYRTGIKISDEELAAVNLHPAEFHGKDWNYTIKPRFKGRTR